MAPHAADSAVGDESCVGSAARWGCIREAWAREEDGESGPAVGATKERGWAALMGTCEVPAPRCHMRGSITGGLTSFMSS